MPLAIYALGLSIFAQGTSELMLTGLVPLIATDLGVSIPQAGLLISAFALGMVIGAPVLAVATLRLPRRSALIGFTVVFIVAHVVGALAPGYPVLLVSRVVAALVYAGFWAVAAVTALGLVPPDRRARALGVVVGGLTVAIVAGLPLGTLVGERLGWRAAFWGVALLSTVAMIAVLATVPRTGSAPEPRPRIAAELRVMRNPRLWLALSTNALCIGSVLVTFSYFAPILTDVTGVPAAVVPAVLALYGIGTVVGITVGGRTGDARPRGTLLVSLAAVAVVCVVLGFALGVAAVVVPLAALLGLAAYAANPALNTQVFALAGEAPTLAAAFNVSAFNVGITVGPAIGAAIVGAGLGYTPLLWTSAALAVLAMGVVLLIHRGATTIGAGAGQAPAPAAADAIPTE